MPLNKLPSLSGTQCEPGKMLPGMPGSLLLAAMQSTFAASTSNQRTNKLREARRTMLPFRVLFQVIVVTVLGPQPEKRYSVSQKISHPDRFSHDAHGLPGPQ